MAGDVLGVVIALLAGAIVVLVVDAVLLGILVWSALIRRSDPAAARALTPEFEPVEPESEPVAPDLRASSLAREIERLAAVRRALTVASDRLTAVGRAAAVASTAQSAPSAPAGSAVLAPARSALPGWARPIVATRDSRILLGYLAALTVAGMAVTYAHPLFVFALHGGIVAVAAVHLAVLERVPSERAFGHRLTPFLLSFLLVTLIRLISLTLPLARIEPAYRYLSAGVPMVLGAVLVIGAVGYSRRDVGLTWSRPMLQFGVIGVSIVFGFVEYLILRPEPLGMFPWFRVSVLPALAVGFATGFPEELIFRGIMQTATRSIIGRWNVLYVSLVFAVMHIGYRSAIDFAFVLGVGLFYGWAFERSRSIVGISIGHGLANIVLFFVAPNLAFMAALTA